VHLDARLVRRVLGCLQESPLIEFARDLARIPSVFGSERTLAEAAARRMGALGFEVQTVDVEKDRPNVLGWVRGSGGGPSLMFNGHTDTVVQSLGWTKPLYGGDLEDGRIYGHGVSNMKASDAAMIYAADAIRRAGVKLKGDLLIALVVGECQGGVGTRDLMARGVRTDTFLCAEPTDFGILTLHAASQYLRVAVTGRTGHPGAYDRGLSAVQKMLELTTRLGPMHEAMRPGGWMTFQPDPAYGGLPRYHLATIRGALTKDFLESWSSTPDYCTAVFNVRATPNQGVESTKADLERVLSEMQAAEGGWAYEVTVVRSMPAFEAPPEGVAVRALVSACDQVTGTAPPVGALEPYMFIASDAGIMQATGMRDGVLMGPGRFTSATADEYVEVEKLILAAKVYALMALDVCGVAS